MLTKRFTLLLTALLATLLVFAQQASRTPMISFTTDEKVIFVNELGLPPTTTLIEALRIVPELVSSDILTIMSLFDVQIDDVPVGEAKSSVLLYTHISEVEHVEVTTNPTSAQNSSGVTGVINVIMKPAADGVTGNASLDISSNFAVLPSASVNYKKDGLNILSSLYLRYSSYSTNEAELYQTTDNDYNHKSESAKLHLKYDFNPYDHLTLWFMQNLEKDNARSVLEKTSLINDSIYRTGTQTTNSPVLSSDINVMMKYERTTDRAGEKILASLSYSNRYSDNVSDVVNNGALYKDLICSSFNNSYISRPNNLSAAFYYRAHLLSDTIKHQLRIKPGMNLDATINNSSSATTYIYSNQDNIRHQLYDDFTRKVRFAPYLHFDYAWGPIAACITARYQLTALISRGETTAWQTNLFHDLLGNFSLTFVPADGHQLRFSTSHTNSSPTNLQLFSNPYYTNYDRMWHVGDSSLVPTYYDNAQVQYVYHFNNGIHEVQLSSAIEYILVENPIMTVRKTSGQMHVEYETYETQPDKHVVNASAAIYWKYKIFSLAFCANIYDRISDDLKNELYYNFQLTAVLKFERNWTLSSQMLFLMPQKDFGILASISKAWGPWSARLTFDNHSNRNLMAGFTYMF